MIILRRDCHVNKGKNKKVHDNKQERLSCKGKIREKIMKIMRDHMKKSK